MQSNLRKEWVCSEECVDDVPHSADEVFFGLVPHEVVVHFVTVALVLRMLFFALLSRVVVEGIRRRGVEDWLVQIM